MIVALGCRGCRTCDEVCKYNAIIRNGSKVVKIDETKCQKCYDCVDTCPYSALIVMD
ncbi:ferredoxin [Archaeoglobales archaeon]|nr:MAG: ferredoxin [Archaeoglobales archaeon]